MIELMTTNYFLVSLADNLQQWAIREAGGNDRYEKLILAKATRLRIFYDDFLGKSSLIPLRHKNDKYTAELKTWTQTYLLSLSWSDVANGPKSGANLIFKMINGLLSNV